MLEGKFGDEFLEVQAVMQLVECTTQHDTTRHNEQLFISNTNLCSVYLMLLSITSPFSSI
jgi:hypothetical protein